MLEFHDICHIPINGYDFNVFSKYNPLFSLQEQGNKEQARMQNSSQLTVRKENLSLNPIQINVYMCTSMHMWMHTCMHMGVHTYMHVCVCSHTTHTHLT